VASPMGTPPRQLTCGLQRCRKVSARLSSDSELVPDQPIGRCRNSFLARISGVDASSDEVRNVPGMRHLSNYWIGGEHTHVFTDSVRSCKRVFELVLPRFSEGTATPFATPLAKYLSDRAFP
jgi:hypothetical protein